ncbi:hypothetical protein PC116_g22067 [Phytophthora cactorum]|uniref:Uncharacterized protein n=1 Tax=Phytophthora cactorum TaxID=29920 RepID=A0A8T1AS67_9STRA|nr:hypothetical protein Pcac1_g9117 [Phytophthora cactorum]KAG2798592.1 hypothetical protein PC112_g21282 [Phytophthora cactorum]KAG2807225.1 hypothetical protein PC111_g17020 [Phytophthora cactorum]KAG2829921.1 hypothetical protein PC113_g21202 [Phytophthora cactorum]KAG2885434.1 hypothetical protein PC114_g19679 [Phytophthora cactorum]
MNGRRGEVMQGMEAVAWNQATVFTKEAEESRKGTDETVKKEPGECPRRGVVHIATSEQVADARVCFSVVNLLDSVQTESR